MNVYIYLSVNQCQQVFCFLLDLVTLATDAAAAIAVFTLAAV